MKLRFKEFMEPLQGYPAELELPSLHDPAISAFKDHFILWDRVFSGKDCEQGGHKMRAVGEKSENTYVNLGYNVWFLFVFVWLKW